MMYYFTLTRISLYKKHGQTEQKQNSRVEEDVDISQPLCIAGANTKCTNTMGNILIVLEKVKPRITK